MPWRNREQAGRELAKILTDYAGKKDAVVLGLPRGGVAVASEAAKALGLPLDVIITRKIGMPGNPELALGAIDEYGEGIFNETLTQYSGVSAEYVAEEIEKQKEEIKRRLSLYRQNRPPLSLHKKTAVLIDDGVATGSTMFAAIRSCRRKGARKVVVAVPVIALDTLSQLEQTADEILYLDSPLEFGAVGRFYEEFNQVEDEVVVRLLNS